MLEQCKDIDAVVVSTPEHTHAVAVLMAIQGGKHVARGRAVAVVEEFESNDGRRRAVSASMPLTASSRTTAPTVTA